MKCENCGTGKVVYAGQYTLCMGCFHELSAYKEGYKKMRDAYRNIGRLFQRKGYPR